MRSSLSFLMAVLLPASVLAQQAESTDTVSVAETAPLMLATTTAPAAPAPAAAASSNQPVVPAAVPVQLTGQVLNSQGKPLVGATVYVKELGLAASTDARGAYALQVPPGVHTLAFGYGGYAEQQVQASNFLPITITLLPADKARRRDK